jgi:hypothetical protein
VPAHFAPTPKDLPTRRHGIWGAEASDTVRTHMDILIELHGSHNCAMLLVDLVAKSSRDLCKDLRFSCRASR